ncbi:MAG: hypothetical protein S4CHLAM102_09060 [Chlamydiia bacterium]|nr:hypothetical protein [Chlamydiia bacterium]
MSAIVEGQFAKARTMSLVPMEGKDSLPQDLLQEIILNLEGGAFWFAGNTCRTFRRCQLRVMLERGERVLNICLNVFPAWKLLEAQAGEDEGYSHQFVLEQLADQRRALVDGARGELSRSSETRGQVVGVVHAMQKRSASVDQEPFSRKEELEVVRAGLINAIKQLPSQDQIPLFIEIFCVLIAKGKREEFHQLFESLTAQQKERLNVYPGLAEALGRGEFHQAQSLIDAAVCKVEKQADPTEVGLKAMEETEALKRVLEYWYAESGNFHYLVQGTEFSMDGGGPIFQTEDIRKLFSVFQTISSGGMSRGYFEFVSKVDLSYNSSWDLFHTVSCAAIGMTFDLAETALLLEEFKGIFDRATHGQFKGLVCAEMIKRKEYKQAFKLIDQMNDRNNKDHFLQGLFSDDLLDIEHFSPLPLDEEVLQRLAKMVEDWKGQVSEDILNPGQVYLLTQLGKFAEAKLLLKRGESTAHLQYLCMGFARNGELQKALACASSPPDEPSKLLNLQAIAIQCLVAGNWDEVEETLRQVQATTSAENVWEVKFHLASMCVERGQIDFSDRLINGFVKTEQNKHLFCELCLACHQKGEYPYLFRLIDQYGVPDNTYQALLYTLF